MTSLVDAHAESSRMLQSVVAGVAADDLARPTPCAGWSVADLLAHLGGHERGWAVAFTGARTDVGCGSPSTRGRSGSWTCWRRCGRPSPRGPRSRAATCGSRSSARRVRCPVAVAMRAHLLDMAAHAWDVAAAVRRPLTVPPEVAAIALEVAEGIPDSPDRREPDSLFAPRLASLSSADTFDRALTLLGRDPGWRP